jgi:hypothetical protein
VTASSYFVRIFIDTEFSDPVDMCLISLALVTQNGEEFYGEIDDFPLEKCNDFVRENVLPLLGNVAGAKMSTVQLRDRLLAWLSEIRGTREILIVSYDYFGDWALFAEVLGNAPLWVRPDNIRHRIDEAQREKFFQIAAGTRHHALWDARALRASYVSRHDQ